MIRLFSILKKEYRHYREWRTVLREEGLRGNILKMVRAVRSGRVPFAVWRRRMRICRRCPIYDRELRRCRGPVFGGRALGCGCYVVYTAVTRAPYAGGCWGREVVGPDFGWPDWPDGATRQREFEERVRRNLNDFFP